MCIVGAVGRGRANARNDVRTVQLLLNLSTPNVVGPLVPDGTCGPATIVAIEQFQRNTIGCKDPLGVITPDSPGSTLRALQTAMPLVFSSEKLQGIYIHASPAQVDRYFNNIVTGMAASAINTYLRQTHFLAQIGQESGELRYTEEIASGKDYDGRKDLGNTQPGDGPRFKGRGLIQLTGRNNYIRFGIICKQNFTDGDNPLRLATDPALAVDVATWFWTEHKLNVLADKDDITTITRRINGGLNGFDGRKRLLARAKWFLANPLASTRTDATTSTLIQSIQAVGEDTLWRPRQNRPHIPTRLWL